MEKIIYADDPYYEHSRHSNCDRCRNEFLTDDLIKSGSRFAPQWLCVECDKELEAMEDDPCSDWE
jgi:hypothetical protein